ARSIPISASRICGRRAAFSRATPASSPIIWSPNLDLATLNPRSTPSGPIFPRCRKKWPTASIQCGHVLVLERLSVHAWQLCSAKTGQYTTLLDVVAEPALHGRLLFAGEHTM